MNNFLDKASASSAAKYIVIGAGIGLSAVGLLQALGSWRTLSPIEHWIAAATLYVIAALVGYFCHRHITFGFSSSAPHGSSPIKFIIVNCCAAGATAELSSLLYQNQLCTAAFGSWNASLTFGLASALVSATSFVVARSWVFIPIKPGTKIRRPSLESMIVFFTGLAAFIAWSLLAGRDLNWDFLNYHLYLGQTANGARLHQDFFPASIQSYLSPYAYWPIAAMIAAKWSAPVIGATLGAVHSLVVIATWYLALQLFPGSTRQAIWGRALATIMGVANPLLLSQVGNSFIDLTTAVPVVFGLALLLRALRVDAHRSTILAVAGVFFGLAVGLKLTNAIFGIAAVVATSLICIARSDLQIKNAASLIAGQAIGFLVVYGYWGTRIWNEFGNPFFPGLNTLFQSPDFPLIEIRHQRYLPVGFSDWLLLPIRMLDPVTNIYTEVRAPDARFLAFFCLLPFAAWRARERFTELVSAPLIMFFLVSWILWELSSGNGRYMMPLSIVVGPLVVWCIAALFQRRSIATLGISIALGCLQLASLGLGATYRWSKVDWQREWISATIPGEIRTHPYTLASFSPQSTSWLVGMIHPESRLVNVAGQFAIPVNGPGWSRLSRILEESSEIVAIFPFALIDPKTENPYPSRPSKFAVMAQTYGLQVDIESCTTGYLNESVGPHVTLNANQNDALHLRSVTGLFFCRATYAPSVLKEANSFSRREQTFDLIEDTCPMTFSPPRAQTICLQESCGRTYFNSDTVLQIDSNGIISFSGYYAPGKTQLGKAGQNGPDIAVARCGFRGQNRSP